MAQSDGGQDRGELKKMMRMAADRPIHMAFAFGADGKAVLKMHKMTQPKALEKALKEESPDARNHRFGMVSVDPQDPKVARFTVNKAVGGAARKLAVALKGTGFSKIQIVMEDGSVVEEGADGEEEMLAPDDAPGMAGPSMAMGGTAGGLLAGGAGQAIGGVLGKGALSPAADSLLGGAFGAQSGHPAAPVHPGTPHPGPTQLPHQAKPHAPPHAKAPPVPGIKPQAGPDAATLTRELSGLVKAMLPVIAKAPEQKSVLTQLATDAQASLKRGDLPQAAAGMEILRQAINDLGGAAPGGAPSAVHPPPIGIGTPVHTGNGRPPPHVGTHPGNGRPAPIISRPLDEAPPHRDASRARPDGDGRDRPDTDDWADNLLDRGQDRDGGADRFGDEERQAGGRRRHADDEGRDGGEGRFRDGDEGEGSERHAGRRHRGDDEGQHRDAGMNGERHAGHGHKGHHEPSVTRKLQKARVAWTATRAKVDADLQRLSKAIMEASDGDDMGDDIEERFMEAVEPVLSELDEELSDLLSRAVDAKDHGDRERLLTDARRTVARYTRFVEGNPIIADLDDNPFLAINVGKSLGTVLSALSSVMR